MHKISLVHIAYNANIGDDHIGKQNKCTKTRPISNSSVYACTDKKPGPSLEEEVTKPEP